MSVVFRADGSSHLGLGHVVRCLALAQYLKQKKGIDSFFVLRAEKDIVRMIETQGFPTFSAPDDFEGDYLFIQEVAKNKNAKIVISDICHPENLVRMDDLKSYLRKIEENFFLMSLGGGTSFDIPGHIVVYPYFRLSFQKPENGKDRNFLLGPSYFIFRDEFLKVRPKKRKISPEARKILVTIGGGDPYRISLLAAKSLKLIEDDLKIKIVIGPAYPKSLPQEIQSALQGKNIQLLDSSSSLPEEMLWCDLAVTGDGLTKYETALTGTPSIMISQPLSEIELNRDFVKAGTVHYLENSETVSPEKLAGEINRFLNNEELRKQMSRKGMEMTDGKGIEKIISHIPPSLILSRPHAT